MNNSGYYVEVKDDDDKNIIVRGRVRIRKGG